MAPVVAMLEQSKSLEPVVAVSGQHRQMLDQVNQLFGISPQHDLDIISARQTLESITIKSLAGVSQLITAERPDAVLVPRRHDDMLCRGVGRVLPAGAGRSPRGRAADKRALQPVPGRDQPAANDAASFTSPRADPHVAQQSPARRGCRQGHIHNGQHCHRCSDRDRFPGLTDRESRYCAEHSRTLETATSCSLLHTDVSRGGCPCSERPPR